MLMKINQCLNMQSTNIHKHSLPMVSLLDAHAFWLIIHEPDENFYELHASVYENYLLSSIFHIP